MNKKCSGCGVSLQTHSKDLEGYVSEKVFDNALLCERCFKIKHYGKYDVVDSKKDFLEIINTINKNKIDSVYLIDLLTMNEEAVNYLKQIKNCKYVLLTKRDLLPKSVRDKKIINYFQEHYGKEYDVMCISSKKKKNIDEFLNKMKKDKIKNIYVLGLTNSGKSTFINSLMESVGNKGNITTSPVPNTTIEYIKISLNEDLTIIDTPGFIDKYSIYNYLNIEKTAILEPKKEIKPKVYQLKPGYSVFVEDILRIDYLGNKTANFVFYINNNLKFEKMKTTTRDTMKLLPKKTIETKNSSDIVINGLGFIKTFKDVKLTIYSLDENLISIRDNLI